MKQLLKSELIVNNDGSIYHLGLKPEYLCDTIITVGDPDRVEQVTSHFDKIDFKLSRREFCSVGGTLNGTRLLVISTGIGTDNIDIVFNELAFLANFDLETRSELPHRRSLKIIRLGTSGSVSEQNRLGGIVYSKYAISSDDLFWFYDHSFDSISLSDRSFPVIECSTALENKFNHLKASLTLTAKGFYGPQFRQSQLQPKFTLKDLSNVTYKDMQIGNIEMETAGIYGMSRLLGFEAISINALLADRRSGDFHSNPQQVIDQMITDTLAVLCR